MLDNHPAPTRAFIWRCELAQLIGMTSRQLANNEIRLGLDRARFDLNKRCIAYKRRMAFLILRNHGLIE